jgi:hypothetical protein
MTHVKSTKKSPRSRPGWDNFDKITKKVFKHSNKDIQEAFHAVQTQFEEEQQVLLDHVAQLQSALQNQRCFRRGCNKRRWQNVRLQS